MSAPENGVRYRVEQLEQRVGEVRERAHKAISEAATLRMVAEGVERRLSHLEAHEIGVLANRLKNVEDGLHDVREAQQANNRVMWTIAVALIAAALTLAASIATGTL